MEKDQDFVTGMIELDYEFFSYLINQGGEPPDSSKGCASGTC